MRDPETREREIYLLSEFIAAAEAYDLEPAARPPQGLVRAACLTARRHRVDRVVDGVEEGLRGAPESGGEAELLRLGGLAGEPWRELGAWREARWVAASVEAAWRLASPTAVAALREVEAAATDPARRQCAAVVRQLLGARRLKAEGAHAAAIAACDAAATSAAGNRLLQALAVELKSDAFRDIGDAAGEKESLDEEQGLFSDLPGGMVEEAGRLEALATEVGPSSARRAGELLVHASRRAVLSERRGDTEGAREIFRQFVRCGRRHWIDPEQPHLGSIQERMARLEAPPPTASDGRRPIRVHEPDRGYAGLEATSVGRVLSEIEGSAGGAAHLVLLAPITGRECRFAFDPSFGAPETQLTERLTALADEPQFRGLGLGAWLGEENAHGARGGDPVLVVEHGVRERPLDALVFAVRLSVVGADVQVAVHPALKGEAGETRALREVLSGPVATDVQTVPGFETLKDRVIKAVADAGQTLSSRAEARRADEHEDS